LIDWLILACRATKRRFQTSWIRRLESCPLPLSGRRSRRMWRTLEHDEIQTPAAAAAAADDDVDVDDDDDAGLTQRHNIDELTSQLAATSQHAANRNQPTDDYATYNLRQT